MGLLGVACVGLIVPTTLAVFDEETLGIERLALSRGIAIALAFMYMQWLFFNLASHAHLFNSKKKGATTETNEAKIMELEEKMDKLMTPKKASFDPRAGQSAQSAVVPMGAKAVKQSGSDDEDEHEGPVMSVPVASGLLLICTILVALQCDFLVESIDPVAKAYNVKKAFIATVLLPMVGNFSEEIAAVTIAFKGNIDMAMGVAMSSAVQISTLAIPAAVLIAWALGVPLDLDFEVYQVKLLFCAIIVSSLSLQDGQANWLKGSMLMTTYIMVAASFWFVHDIAGVEETDEIFGNETMVVALKALIRQELHGHFGDF